VSTSLVYHAFGLKGYVCQATEYKGDTIVFRMFQEPKRQRCPECGSSDLVRRGCVWRDFHGIPIGNKKVVVRLPVQRAHCQACGVLRQVKVGFASGKRRYIRAFERYVVELARRMTLLDVSRHLGVSWDTVKEIQKRYLGRRYTRPRLKGVSRRRLKRVERLEAEVERSDPPSMKYPPRTSTGRKPGKQEGAKGHRRLFLVGARRCLKRFWGSSSLASSPRIRSYRFY